MKKQALFITQAAVIAALYVVLTLFANALGLASNAIQVRFSEALTILPFFTPAAIPGLFVGCIISNILGQCIIWDIIFGSLATLIGAVGTYLVSKVVGKNMTSGTGTVIGGICCTLPPIISNTVIVPLVLAFGYQLPESLPYLMLTVGIGEVISCGILGVLLLILLKKYRHQIFRN